MAKAGCDNCQGTARGRVRLPPRFIPTFIPLDASVRKSTGVFEGGQAKESYSVVPDYQLA